MGDSSDEEPPQLSAHSLAALQEFLIEQQINLLRNQEADVDDKIIDEDWRLSQFWYSDDTAQKLAEEVIRASNGGRIACLCAPTLYKKLRQIKPERCEAIVFEYDKRFDIYGDDFVFYDYYKPLELPSHIEKNSFDVVFADPPHLNRDCLSAIAKTVEYIKKDKVMLCSGAVMEEAALELLNVKPCGFLPKHENNLANEFLCYTNYQTQLNN